MVGILILSHSTFGEALINCASHVLGEPPSRLLQIGMTVREDPDAVLALARDSVAQLDDGSGVLILTDILGATPSNIATQLVCPDRVAAVAGVNLPMLVRALTYRHQPLAVVVRKAVSGGLEGVVNIVPEPHDATR
jgi:PTS system ascorbate-specific IIA component